MNIALYSPATDARYGFALRDERGMGGSEAHAQMRMKEWARRGHRCVVFENWEKTEAREECGVEFRPLRDFDPRGWDLFILQRHLTDPPELLQEVGGFRVFSNNDNLPRQHAWTQDWRTWVYSHVEAVMTYSWFHRRQVIRNHGAPPEKTVCIPHPLEPAEFPEPWECKVPARFIYCSIPNRGLDWVLECWKDIRDAVPGATIRVASDYTIRDGPMHAEKMRNDHGWFFTSSEVLFDGAMGAKALRQEQAAAEILLFPTHAHETFCASVLECQAAGCVPVMTPMGALPTTAVPDVTAKFVGWGNTLIRDDGVPQEVLEEFVAQAVLLAHDHKLRREMAEAGRTRALQEFNVSSICQRWEDMRLQMGGVDGAA